MTDAEDTSITPEISTEVSNDTKCGLGRWKPHFLQRFAHPYCYLIIFAILGLLQGAYFAYLIGIISTLEKRYTFKSKVSGIILIGDNLGPIFTSILVGYYGGKANRPKWISFGMFSIVISYFLSALPYFVYGPARSASLAANVTDDMAEICNLQSREDECHPDFLPSYIPAICCFVGATFLKGFGSTAYYTIGMAYLDDNVPKKQAAIYLGVNACLKMMGPIIGFLLSSFCLSYYEDPTYDPGFSNEDPRWIGAWWIGFLVLGFALLLFTFPMLLFPPALPTKKATKEVDEIQEAPSLKDMGLAMKRIVKTPVLFWFVVSAIFMGNALVGHFSFLPKYLESQFQKSASDANLFSGPTAMVCTQIGMMIGAVIVRKWKPPPQYIAGATTLVDILAGICFTAFMLMGCSTMTMMGTEWQNNEFTLENDCNRQCECTTRIFEPVCATEVQSTYFSPCFAGCTEFNETNFSNCSCIHDSEGSLISASVISNYCPSACNKLLPYLILLGTMRLLGSVQSVGCLLLFFRAPNPKDKSLALGLSESLYNLLVFIPCPLIFGAITDAACLVWEEKCGTTGNCWLYDATKFRYYLHGVALGFTIIGIICDVALTYYSKDLENFYEDEERDKSNRRRSTRESLGSLSLNRSYSVK